MACIWNVPQELMFWMLGPHLLPYFEWLWKDWEVGLRWRKRVADEELSPAPSHCGLLPDQWRSEGISTNAPSTTMFCPSTWGQATMDSTHLNSEPKIYPSFTYFCHTFCHSNAKVINTTYSGELLCHQGERILICSTKRMRLKDAVLRERNSHTYKIQYLIIFLTWTAWSSQTQSS